ncbi:MAG TPA: branched-chain amino acid ABC transporter permease [Symbiobacteriaceae bacterium]
MEQYLQALISGLVLGSVYALIAQGYYVTYITTNTMNFGQGDFLMLGAMTGLGLVTAGFSWWVGLAAAIAVVAAAGIALEYVAIKPLRHFLAIGWILSTVAVSMMVRNIALLKWGRNPMRFPSPFGSEVIRLTDRVGVLPHEIFVVVASAVTMALLFLFLRRTILGKALAAVAWNRDAASLMGINPRTMAVFAYMLSSLLAGLGGVLVGPITQTSFTMGLTLGMRAFSAAMVGGLENPAGILVGGLLIGVVEQVTAGIRSDWKDITPFLLILVVLAVSPGGIFGRRLKEKF